MTKRRRLSTPAGAGARFRRGPRSGSSSPESGVVRRQRPRAAAASLEARQDSEHADRSGDRRRLGEDRVGGGRNPVAARRGDRAHRDDHRDVACPRRQYGSANPLRSEHRSARRIDPHDQRLQIVFLEPALEVSGDRFAARGPRPGAAVDDVAGDGQHARSRRPNRTRDGRRSRRRSGRRDSFRNILTIGAGEFGHALAELGAVADPVDQPGAQGGLGHVAARRLHELHRVGDIVGDGRGARWRLPVATIPTRRRPAPGSPGGPRATYRRAYRARPPT